MILWIQSAHKTMDLVDQSDIWTPKCTEGGGSPNYEISLNFNNFLVASFRRLEKKNGYLTVRLTESKGGSASSTLTVSKCENVDFF